MKHALNRGERDFTRLDFQEVGSWDHLKSVSLGNQRLSVFATPLVYGSSQVRDRIQATAMTYTTATATLDA